MAGGRVIEVHSSAEWESVKGGKGSGFRGNAVVVDFSATWCGPCKMISPVFEKLSVQYPAIKFVKIDVDECQDVASACGIRAMPTFKAYFNGEQVEESTGADPTKLQAMIETLTSKVSAMSGPGQKLGGTSSAAPAPGSDDMRARMAAAAEARMKAMGQ